MAGTKKKGPGPATGSTRRPQPAGGKGWPLLILAAGAALFFHKILLGQAYLWEDFLYSSYPVRNFAATSMAMGQLPLWNPYTFNGMPFLADILTTVFYLPCTLLTLFVRDGQLSPYWLELVIILHFVLAGVSMYFLARSFALHLVPALFAGLAYMLTGFMVVHAIHQPVVTLAAWIPLILLLFRYALLRKSWLWVFLCALTLGHSILAGFPQLSLYIYSLLFLYWLFELFSSFPGKNALTHPAIVMAVRAAAVVFLSVGVAALQLLPTYELSMLSQRASVSYEFATQGSLAWSQLLTLLFPKFFGASGAEAYGYVGPGPYWHYWETCIYLGVLPFLLLLLSPLLWKKQKVIFFLWGIVILSLFYAMGRYFFLHGLFYEYVPGFSGFRNPARAGIVFAFAAVLLAAFALDHLLYGEKTARQQSAMRNVLLGTAGVAAAIWLLALSGALDGVFPFLHGGQQGAGILRHLSLWMGLIVVSVLALLGGLFRSAWTGKAGAAVLAILFLDLLLFGEGQNNGRTDPTAYFDRTDRLVQFFQQQGAKEIFRVNTRNSDGMIMDRNQGMIDRIFMTEGYTPLALQRLFIPVPDEKLFDLLNVKYKTVTDQAARALTVAQHPTYLPRAFFLYDARVAENEQQVVAELQRPEFNHKRTAVLEQDPGISFVTDTTAAEWTARITAYANNEILLDVVTPRTGLLVLSETYYPGWKAYVDGSSVDVLRADYTLRAVVVPAGRHGVAFRFVPDSFRVGGLMTIAALSICGIGIVVGARRRRDPDLQVKAKRE